jgi:uncharacterized protein involved in oxidation of intracellular sulfur
MEVLTMRKYLIIMNNGPEDANRATVPFLTAKALVDKGHEVSMWLYNNAVYLMKEGCYEYIQAPGLPPLEDLVLFLTMAHPISIFIGESCAIGRGLVDEKGHQPTVDFVAGKLATTSDLADLIVEADHVIGF